MQSYFAVPIEGIADKSFKYFGDAAKKTKGSVTLDVSIITFFEDWWHLTDFSVVRVHALA